jgi:pimeloyl-ACP methyl ester carboxylesterase
VIDIRDETFEGTYPFAPHYFRVNGFEMHFVDEGKGEPLLFLHGDPTWGYLWRKIVVPLAAKYRCVVPDQMGMGKSGNPLEPNPHRLRHHAAYWRLFYWDWTFGISLLCFMIGAAQWACTLQRAIEAESRGLS